MMNTASYFTSSLLFAAACFLPSCNAKYDMVTFSEVGSASASTKIAPRIAIDTNVSAGMMGGDVKSNKPYKIKAHYIDDTFTFASAEFTKLTVTYADGTTDAGASALNFPQRFLQMPYEDHNSVAGGAVVVTKSRIIQAEFPGSISRDESFTLLIEGKFTKDDGTVIPFTIKEKFDMSHDKRTQSWADFVSGC